MNAFQANLNRRHLDRKPYALCREGGHWRLTFAGQPAILKHELGALYVAYLLLRHPAKEPLHAVALKAREFDREPAGPEDLRQQRQMGLPDAGAVRALWRRQRALERVLADPLVIEPVKAEALRELEEVSELLRTSRWLSHDGAGRCVRAVSTAIQRFHRRLLEPVDAQGRPDPVLAEFADHLHRHLLMPSGRGCKGRFRWLAMVPSGFFTYIPPAGVVWNSLESRVLSLESAVHRPQSTVHSAQSAVRQFPAAVQYLSGLLCGVLALTLLATGCAGPRPLKGGKAAITRNPAGVVQQTVAQGENAAQPSRQDQETIKVPTYTLPAASRIDQSLVPVPAQPSTGSLTQDSRPKTQDSTLSTLNSQPSTSYILSAPMPVVEREETRARTELGAASDA